MPGITGKDGALYLNGVKVALVYDLTIEVDTPTVNCGAKGDAFESVTPGRASGRITGKRRILTTGVFAQDALAANSSLAVAYEINLIEGNPGFQRVSGFGVFTRGSFAFPYDNLADDSFEMAMQGAPSFF